MKARQICLNLLMVNNVELFAIPLFMEEYYLGLWIGNGMKTFAYIEAIFDEFNKPIFKGCYSSGKKLYKYMSFFY